jgi:acyl-CoA synthetase (AMP-forming)/AMP-acid ligase II
MPGVSVRLVCADTGTVIPDSTLKEQGEIQVMGPNIFTGALVRQPFL